MRITSHPLRGTAATKAVRSSKAFDSTVRVHLRFVQVGDAPLISALRPGPSLGVRRDWIQHYKFLEAEGRDFYFVIVENGRDRGLVRMNDFGDIGGESSFGWSDFVALRPGLLTATASSIYSLGFDTLGYARAHMAVPRSSRDILTFHLNTGAELEYDDGEHRYFRFGAETYDQVRNDAIRRRTFVMAERA